MKCMYCGKDGAVDPGNLVFQCEPSNGCAAEAIPDNQINIIWLSDTYDCDDCGTSWSDGAKVYLNGKKIIDFQPVAHCFGGSHWDRDSIYREILFQLGYKVEEE